MAYCVEGSTEIWRGEAVCRPGKDEEKEGKEDSNDTPTSAVLVRGL